jgi:hypothetical protein
MNPTVADLHRDSTQAAASLERIGREHDVPLLRSFPTNSCEAASAVLGLVLRRKYAAATVHVVRGHDVVRGGWHFWVEVDDHVVDITAHQFERYDGPLVMVSPSPLESEFAEVDRLRPTDAMQGFSSAIRHRLDFVVTELEKTLLG